MLCLVLAKAIRNYVLEFLAVHLMPREMIDTMNERKKAREEYL